ncbi:hypothetical protein [Kitasatospora sp. HPMI-4]|uniref:hypothetical protein n=1 Tax=Kitasatospora sp. HPMI-4 TaxID=3448443 RepID=UPI003F1C8B85
MSVAKTYEEYKAERRRRVRPPDGWRPLDDYDPAEADWMLARRGVPSGFPFCECGSPNCPDKGAYQLSNFSRLKEQQLHAP